MRKNERRRLYSVINQPLQYKFLAMVLAYGMITVILVAGFIFVPDIINMNNQDLSYEMREAASQRILFLLPRFWPSIIAMILVICLHSWRSFHRIVGPLFRFKRAFEKIAEGNLSFLVKLRKKDYLDSEAMKLNQMIDVLAEKWESMQTASLDALRSIELVEQSFAAHGDEKKENLRLLELHRQHLKILTDQVQYFRLNDEDKEEDNKKE
jgi:methyl-accepting chemotaxis protein